MPKIVGQNKNVAKRITCKSCGAINEYLPNEVRTLWEGKDYSGGADGAKGFNCGQCAEQVIVESW